MGNLPFDDWEAEQLERDPDLRTAYDALEPEHQRNRAFVDAQIAMHKLETPELFHLLAERDDNGYWIVSEDIALMYGDGPTLPAALRDLASTLEEYCAITKAGAERGDVGEPEQWERVKVWVEGGKRNMPLWARLSASVAVGLGLLWVSRRKG
jgi:hypothetical protein